MMNRLKTFLAKTAFPILKQPKNMKNAKIKIITLAIIASLVFDVMSFALKGVEFAMANGMMVLSVIMLILYFSQRILENTYSTYSDLQKDSFDQLYNDEIIQTVMNLCNATRSKVFKNDNGKSTLMETAEIISYSKNYINSVWKFWWTIPTTIYQCLSMFIMIIAMIIVEMHDSNQAQTSFIMSLLIICIIIYFFLGKKRIKLRKSYRQVTKTIDATKDVLFTEIKNIEFISQNDFDYHAKKFRDHLINSSEVIKQERLKLNGVFIQRSFIASGFMIAILLFKIFNAQTIDISVIMNVVAVSTVYSSILAKIGDILSAFEGLAETIIDINAFYPYFKEIYDVYLEEISKKFENENVDSITVNAFCATQDPKKNYLLMNNSSFSLDKGDFVLVQGPTGCGKSTLLKLLTGKLRICNNPIIFGSGKNGYLHSISYQTDKSMANGFALNEIILSDDYKKINRAKLLEILHGVCLYPEILRMATNDNDIKLANLDDDDKVLELLKFRKISQFSSGQQQRLAISKLLYTMDKFQQVIALDEAFNRLDDSTAEACIQFVCNFSQREISRIVLLATHQVELVRKICNKEISFVSDLNTSKIVISTIKP